ncbi:MAG: transglutaminase domain-containing protein [Anaerolineaceae bacterium]|nr:transglutaminase domain-containing protein [Anaerolineaceae bacterium]
MKKRTVDIHQPLPQSFNGRFQTFLFGIGISLVCLLVGGAVIWGGQAETGLRLASMVFFGLWPLAVGLLFLYLSLIFTWRLTLRPEQIILRHTFHERVLAAADLLGVRLFTVTTSRSPQPLLVMELALTNGRSLRINQNELSIPLPQLVDLMVHHYQLPLAYEREAARIHHTTFGAGSRRPFTDYLNGESTVQVQSVADICRWLRQCEYVRDADLFDQKDVWQHPGEFEARQKGDCEDHALWAWRKLKELNIPAEFVVGRMQWGDEFTLPGAHAWVTYRENGRTYILESTYKQRPLIYPLDELSARYTPWFSVDEAMQTYRYLPVATRGSRESKI